MSRDDYLYATGVVRSQESRALNPNDVERMVGAPDLETAFKVFSDTDYFDNIQDLKPNQFLSALDADLLQVHDRIVAMAPDEEIVKFIFMRYDFRNLKLLYKSHFTNKEIDGFISKLGLENPEKLNLAIKGEKVEILPYCQRAIEYVRARVENEAKGATPSLIGRWFDRKYFKEYYDQAKKLNSSFIENFVGLQIDLINLKTFIRGKLLGLANDYIVSEIIINEAASDADHLSLDFYSAMVKLPLLEALGKIRVYLPLRGQVVLNEYLNNQSLTQLEKELENIELDYLRQTKYIDNGPELILGYYYAKRNAIRNTRIIMTGKANQIPPLQIKELLRELY